MVGSAREDLDWEERLDERIEKQYARNRQFTDNTVSAMQEKVKRYGQNMTEFENRHTPIQELKSLSQSKSQTLQQQSQLRFTPLKKAETIDRNGTPLDDRGRDKSPQSVSNNGNSRVSYLR
jgi:exonuclease VII large subunit